MIEISTSQAARDAYARAHAERGRAVRRTWSWLFGSR